eukprot:scaffold647981_cov27-Prasinocladus_malaysianus.AAC.3
MYDTRVSRPRLADRTRALTIKRHATTGVPHQDELKNSRNSRLKTSAAEVSSGVYWSGALDSGGLWTITVMCMATVRVLVQDMKNPYYVLVLVPEIFAFIKCMT